MTGLNDCGSLEDAFEVLNDEGVDNTFLGLIEICCRGGADGVQQQAYVASFSTVLLLLSSKS